MDANTYYLNQHMDTFKEEVCVKSFAQEQIENPDSDFYPWTPERVHEALSESPDIGLARIVEGHYDDRKLAMAVREIVLRYWLDSATEHFLENN
jgi:hypothetical protein